jgi:HK97 family phage major capsid protein
MCRMNHHLSPDINAPADARANVAAMLANYYSELAGLDRAPSDSFSLVRHLRALANGRPSSGRELEIIESASMLMGQQFDPSRAWVPLRAIRTMTTATGGKGGYLVGVDVLEPADVLRPWSVVASAGAMILSGLSDGVLIPRAAAATTSTWVGENSVAPSESPPTLGNESLTPKTAIALIKFSAQLLRQGEAAEPFVRAQLLAAVGEAFDKAYFAGAGGVEPLGLLQHAGIGAQIGTSLAHAGLLAMRKAVLNAGGKEDGLQWVGTPNVQELLGARERSTGGGRFLWDSDGVLGKPAYATKNAPTSGLIVGDFSRSVAGIFGPGVRIEVDPSQDFNSAGLVARVLLMCDVAFPQPAAFCVATPVT